MKNVKKIILVISFIFLGFTLVGCDWLDGLFTEKTNVIDEVYASLFVGVDTNNLRNDFSLPSLKKKVTLSYTSSDEEVISIKEDIDTYLFTVIQGELDVKVDIEITLKHPEEGTVTKTKKMTVLKDSKTTYYEYNPYPNQESMKLLIDAQNETYGISGLPSGNDETYTQNILIIPVEFTNYEFNSVDLLKLKQAFFGTEEETGWESLKTYYAKSSYNKVNFEGKVLEPFQTNKTSTYYQNQYLNDSEQTIFKEAIEYYDSTIDYSLYDQDKDGYIDGVYLVYAAPVMWDEYSESDGRNLWWAWQYQYNKIGKNTKYDGVKMGFYVWAGIDFIYEPLYSISRFEDYSIPVNATTFIHETGHMFGLDDYYDYDESTGPKGGLGGADMMDYNMGDHNPFSKMMLGWTTPMVINDSIIVRIKPFAETGEVLLIPRYWQDSYFGEYFLVDYYTPTNLNEAHKGRSYFSTSGIRVFHVDATLGANTAGYQSVFVNDNSDSRNKLIKYVDASNAFPIEKGTTMTTRLLDNMLFNATSSFNFGTYKWYNNENLGFSFKVNLMTDEFAEIEIIFNR